MGISSADDFRRCYLGVTITQEYSQETFFLIGGTAVKKNPCDKAGKDLFQCKICLDG